MANSIGTNIGALQALGSLKTATRRLEGTGKQLETGYRVADASDDAAVFSVAQGVRNELKQSHAIRVGISSAIGVVEVGMAGATAFSSQIQDLKAIAIKATDGGLAPEQRDIYANDFQAKLAEMRQVLEQSSFAGRNLLIEFAVPFNTFIGTVQTYSIPADAGGGVLTVTGYRLDYVWANLALTSADSQSNAQAAIAAIESYSTDVDDALAGLGASANKLHSQIAFLLDKEDAMLKGLGGLVDSDIAAIEAERQSALVQQQLATEALSIAIQRPGQLLGLLK